jgi:hypothetical protein
VSRIGHVTISEGIPELLTKGVMLCSDFLEDRDSRNGGAIPHVLPDYEYGWLS